MHTSFIESEKKVLKIFAIGEIRASFQMYGAGKTRIGGEFVKFFWIFDPIIKAFSGAKTQRNDLSGFNLICRPLLEGSCC